MPKTIHNIDKEIISLLDKNNSLSINELVEIFGYSVPVLRRICQNLAITHNLVYKRGYLSYPQLEGEIVIKKEKHIIALEACNYIQEGDTIFLGAGTTIHTMCQYLHKFQSLTVITNSLPVLAELLKIPTITTICVGGLLQHQDKALVGSFTDNFIQNFHINKVFLGSEGFDITKGATRSVIQKNMPEHSISTLDGKIYLLMESGKFEQHCTWVWLPLAKIDTIITDSTLSKAHRDILKKSKINLNIVQLPYCQ